MYDVVIIGAGVSGAAAARELGRFLLETAGAAAPETLQAVCYETPGPALPWRNTFLKS